MNLGEDFPHERKINPYTQTNYQWNKKTER